MYFHDAKHMIISQTINFSNFNPLVDYFGYGYMSPMQAGVLYGMEVIFRGT